MEGQIKEKRAFKTMAENLKTNPQKLKQIYIQAYRKNYTLNKNLLNYALEEKKKGLKIAILSDQWWISKEALITKEFYKNFNPVIISCDVRIRKPNPKVYRMTLKRLRVKPKESVFIDNQKWNIVPAKKLGMRTVLFKNNKQTIKELNKILK